MISSIFENEVKDKVDNVIRQSMLANSGLQQSQPNLDDKHEGIKCSNCKVNPILGPRFMCPQCHEFNLCYLCEENLDHSHALLKVKCK